MRRTVLAALLLTLGPRGWTDGPNGGQGETPFRHPPPAAASAQVRTTPSRILELNEKRANVLQEQAPAETVLRLEAQAGEVLVRERPDGVAASSPMPGNVLNLRESAPRQMRSPHDKRPPPEPVVADAPLALKPAMSISAPRAKGPDERPLWRMLDAQRYQALLERVDRLRAAYPAWRPPSRLVALAREGWLRQRIEQARETGDRAALVLLAQEHPDAFGCEGIEPAWWLAEAHAATGRQSDAEELVRRLLACPNEADRLATLYKSREWVGAGWEGLVELEERMPRSEDGEKKFRQLRYDYRTAQLLAAMDGGKNEMALQLLSTLQSEIERRADAGTMLLAGWIRYRAGQAAEAASAFALILQWDAVQHEARRGLALIALQEKRFTDALYQAEALPERAEGRNELLRDIRVAQAQSASDAGRHEETVRMLDAARGYASLPRHAEMLDAWSRLQLGDAVGASERFAHLYGQVPDTESAQGVLLAFKQAGMDAELKALAQSGPLAGLLARHDAVVAFNGKRFLAAGFLDPQAFGGIGSVGAQQATLIAAARSKSGSPGMSQLDVRWQPALEAAIRAGATGELRLRFDHVLLENGSLPANMPVGNFPATAAAYTHSPTAQVRGWQPRLSWRDEREHVWEAQLGTTPTGGAAGTTWTGRVAYRDRNGAWHWAAYREPVRESILSWTGLRDPYQGGAWGRVMRNGLLAGGRFQLNDRWAMSGRVSAERLEGEQVAANRRIAGEAGVSYSMTVAGMDYAALGMSASTDRFAHNLSHFTVGHGGYFSPQRYWRVGPSLDFMTEENRGFVIRGRVSAGRTGKREAAAPFFPLAPDGRSYAASSGTGTAYDVELSAVWRVNAYVQVGAAFAKRNSPQYADRAALGFIRIQFEPGKSSLSSDLPPGFDKELF